MAAERAGEREVSDALAALPLVDHHCHSVVRAELTRPALESLLTEGAAPAPGTSAFDSLLGLSVRRWCAPVLDLPPLAAPEEYVDRRTDLGTAEVTRRMLRAAGLAALLVDGGHRAAELLGEHELAVAAGAPVRTVLRLEPLLERAADEGADAGSLGPAAVEALHDACDAGSGRAGAAGAGAAVVALKSVAAYRVGLDLPSRPPSAREVTAAAAAWLARQEPGAARVDDPVLISHLVWAGVETGLPIQFHTGFGDADEDLHRAHPLRLTAFCRAVSVPVVLLHCYPYHREAAWLAHVLPHVFFDVGLAATYVGARAPALLGEALEVAPFAKLLYSSDAFGLPELFLLGALRFRQACARVLGGLVAAGEATLADAVRVAEMLAAGNARRAYGLDAAHPTR